MSNNPQVTQQYNKFILNDLFSDPATVFSRLSPSINDLSSDCIYTLDANVLLAPFQLNDPLGVTTISIYRHLSSHNRLYVPKRAAQEFAKNRTKVLADAHGKIVEALKAANNSTPSPIVFPFLHGTDAYGVFSEAARTLMTARKEYLNTLGQLGERLTDWVWNDPVSSLYRDIFTSSTIIDHGKQEKEIEDDLVRRTTHSIPPGFKDKKKDDGGIGDVMIWHTLKAVAKEKGKHVIFVSNEQKPDWAVVSHDTVVGVRPELCHEFLSDTGFHMGLINYSTFLKLNGATKEDIRNAKVLETTDTHEFLLIQDRIAAILSDLHGIASAFCEWVDSGEPQAQGDEYVYIDNQPLEPLADAFVGCMKKYHRLYNDAAGLQLLEELQEQLKDMLSWNRRLAYLAAQRKHSGDIDTVNLMVACTRFVASYEKWLAWDAFRPQ
jgi:PIN like domain